MTSSKIDHILALAKRRAETGQHRDAVGMMNTPVGYEKGLQADARYRLASDAFERATKEYSAAIAALTTDELVELSRLPAKAKAEVA